MSSSLYSHQDANVRKTWLLMTIFLVIVIALGYFVSLYYNSPFILYGFIIFSVVMNLVSYWQSDKIALAVSGAKPVGTAEYRELHHIVENLSITAGLPKPRVYIINDQAPNAFATGRDKEHAAVAVTVGLLQILDRSELEGVIAHELSHIGNRDILISTVVVVLVGFIALISDFFTRSLIWGGGRRDNRNNTSGVLMLIGIVLMILSPIIATLIQLAISRKREFLADASGALLTRYPEGLANALRKIASSHQPMKSANNATAHLFIANPFGAKARQGFHKLFMTHPPTEDRIRALLNQ